MLTRKSVKELHDQQNARRISTRRIPNLSSQSKFFFHANFKSSFHPSMQYPHRGIRERKPTLNGGLGTDSGSQTHGAGHEVGEDLVGAGALVGLVFAEVRDLQSRAAFIGAGEGALERGLRIGNSPPLLAGGDDGAGGGELLAGASAQQSVGSRGERHGEWTTKGMSSIAIRVGASARDGRAGEAEKWMKSEVKLEPELSPTRDPLSQ